MIRRMPETAKLEVAKSALKFPGNDEEKSGEATGKFTLNGKSDDNFKVKYKAKRTGSDLHVQGSTAIDIREFQIQVPCYLGVCVDPHVKIEVKFKLRDG